MADVSFCFEVHQPMRLKKGFFWDRSLFRKVMPGKLLDFYFDEEVNKHIMDRVARKCYLPANKIILEEIKRFEDTDRPFKVAYSFSGIFIEQCRRYNPEVLESFVDLVDTGLVEVLEQTYYHSLVGLYNCKDEFVEQVKMHRELMWDIFGSKPTIFENTELLYNDEIAHVVEKLGYKGIFAEGVIADPNYVYRPEGCSELALMLRNYQLTDDLGFRFSSRDWEEYPLTSDKYAAWIAATPGECINIFCDYETFGEHHWPETGILEFLKFLPEKILSRKNLRFTTPGDVIDRHTPSDIISVEEATSWADLERDTSCWIGNALQWACFSYQKELELPVKESEDSEILEVWRCLGLSDHLYYIYTRGGGPGDVHSYFSPYNNAYDAAVTYFSVLSDLHIKLKERLSIAEDPFIFSTGIDEFTGDIAWSLNGLRKVISHVNLCSIEYHMMRGDFVRWARSSLYDDSAANQLEELQGLSGEALRNALLRALESNLNRAEELGI